MHLVSISLPHYYLPWKNICGMTALSCCKWVVVISFVVIFLSFFPKLFPDEKKKWNFFSQYTLSKFEVSVIKVDYWLPEGFFFITSSLDVWICFSDKLGRGWPLFQSYLLNYWFSLEETDNFLWNFEKYN